MLRIHLIFVVCMLVPSVSAFCNPAHSLTVGAGLVNPVGFHEGTPVFSWKLPDGEKRQTAYRIEANSSGRTWDSGWVESDRSTFVPFGGAPLVSRERVEWRVDHRDESGKEAGWSEPAKFEMGLLSATDWRAKWIRPSGETDPTKEAVGYLRRSFFITKTVARARLYATARGVFEVQLNGRRIGADHFANGFTSYNHHIDTLTYDVTTQLSPGDNTLEGLLGAGWFGGRFPFASKKLGPYGKEPALLA